MQNSSNYRLIVTLEENVITGGYGQQVLSFVNELALDVPVINVAIPDQFVEQGSIEQLKQKLGLDADSIVSRIQDIYTKLDF